MHGVPPFIPNSHDNVHCVGAVYRMVFKHFLRRDLTWEAIDAIGKTIPHKGSWNVPYDIALAKAGIRVRNIEHTDFTRLHAEGLSYLAEAFGKKNAEYYVRNSNVANIIGDIPEFLRIVPHESRKATIEDIVTALSDGHLIAAEIDAGALSESGKFSLHFVLLYGMDGNDILLHDPGLPPGPSRAVPIQTFLKCFAYPGASCGIDIFSRG